MLYGVAHPSRVTNSFWCSVRLGMASQYPLFTDFLGVLCTRASQRGLAYVASKNSTDLLQFDFQYRLTAIESRSMECRHEIFSVLSDCITSMIHTQHSDAARTEIFKHRSWMLRLHKLIEYLKYLLSTITTPAFRHSMIEPVKTLLYV